MSVGDYYLSFIDSLLILLLFCVVDMTVQLSDSYNVYLFVSGGFCDERFTDSPTTYYRS
jgi:hypothetical protein